MAAAAVDGRHEQVAGDVCDAAGKRPGALRRGNHSGVRRLQPRRIQSTGIGAVLGDDAHAAAVAFENRAACHAQQPGAVRRHPVEDLLGIGALDACVEIERDRLQLRELPGKHVEPLCHIALGIEELGVVDCQRREAADGARELHLLRRHLARPAIVEELDQADHAIARPQRQQELRAMAML